MGKPHKTESHLCEHASGLAVHLVLPVWLGGIPRLLPCLLHPAHKQRPDGRGVRDGGLWQAVNKQMGWCVCGGRGRQGAMFTWRCGVCGMLVTLACDAVE
jgi:hypothetical protein